jgi:hypothetical protein
MKERRRKKDEWVKFREEKVEEEKLHALLANFPS